MATSNRIRALNRLPFDFEDGLKVGGVDVTSLNQAFTPAGAGLIGFTPVGNLSAGNVQAALAELESEKVGFARLDDTDGSSLVGYDGGTVQDVMDSAKPMADYTALRAYTGRATSVRITSNGIAGFFYRDDADTTSVDNGGTIIVSGNGKRWKRLFDGPVNVKWFGAKGNGVDDDSAAFIAANNWLMTAALITSYQVFSIHYFALDIPSGVYKIKGNRIFGSQLATGSNGTFPPRMLNVRGQGGASLIWEVENEDDELFYFDGTTDACKVSGLTIYLTRQVPIATGAGHIFRFYSNTALQNQANASKFYLSEVTVRQGRPASGAGYQRAKSIFKNTGNAMCDCMLIQNCRFSHFQKVWIGDNQQAVNITFHSSAFWGASSAASTPTIYFDFSAMGDNFNIVNCTFSVFENETVLKTTATLSGGYITQSSGYNFNFTDTRFEIISGTAGGSWNLCAMDFGRINLTNSNFAIGAGQYTTKTVVKVYESASLNFENCQFNKVDFYFPIFTIKSTGAGVCPPYGALLKNCVLPSATDTKYYFTDGVTTYSIKDLLVTGSIPFKVVKFQNCGYFNRESLPDWQFVSGIDWAGRLNTRKHESVSYSGAGIAFGKILTLPPYQEITKITLNMIDPLTSGYDKFRVYIGDRSLNNYFEVANLSYGTAKANYVLFEGAAAVFYDDYTKQTVEVVAYASGAESNALRSEITVEYKPIDARSLGFTTVTDAFIINRYSVSYNSGTTALRPTIDLKINQQYFDTTLGKPIWWSGTAWKDAAGTTV